MRNMKPLVATAMLAVSSLSLSACGSAGQASGTGSQDPIIIGAAVGQSGLMADYDMPPLNALKMKVDEINAAGGLNGRQVKVIEQDTQSDISRGATVAQSLIQEGADIVVASCDFDYGGPAASVAQQAGLLSFSLCAASPKFGVQGIGDLAFTPRGSIATESAVLTNYALEKGWKKVALILDEGIAATSGLCKAFNKYFPAAGGTITGTSTYQNTDSSFGSQIETVKRSGADAVLLCGVLPAGATVLRQLRASGVDLPILAGDPFDGTYWTKSVPGVSNLHAAAAASIFGDSKVEGANELFAKYEKAYGEKPIRGDAIFGTVIGELIQAAVTGTDGSSEGAKLAEYLESNKVPTSLGEYSYDAEAHISLTMPWEMLEFTNGKPASVGVVAPKVDVALTDGA